MLNDIGGIEADITLLFETPERFTMISGSGFMVRDVNWLQKHLPKDGSVRLRDATSERAVINICGPRARDVLQRLTDSDLSNEAFPFLTARTIEVGYAVILAARIGYVGELGYELHVPVEYAGYLHEVLSEAGQPEGIRDVGYRAIESCRLEKFYLYWSSDISPYTNPLEAGLGGLVSFKKGFFAAIAPWRRCAPLGRDENSAPSPWMASFPCTAQRRSCMAALSLARSPAPALATRSAKPSPMDICPLSWQTKGRSKYWPSENHTKPTAPKTASTIRPMHV